jgi:hypothetical protein
MTDLDILEKLQNGTFRFDATFGEIAAAGSSPFSVLCNSVPKSGTYLLMELVKTAGLWTDIEHHGYTSGICRVRGDGYIETERKVPALLWASALKAGYNVAAHVEYSPFFEEYILNSPRHKMLFIIRDPRDLVISWVDFVYNFPGYSLMGRTNAYLRDRGAACYPTDEGKIDSTIDGLPNSGIVNFIPWIDSPACLTIRFEDLYSELNDFVDEKPTIERICAYLEIPRAAVGSFRSALGKGLTTSSRTKKIGAYHDRMNDSHFLKLQEEEFQKLVLSFGYEATPDLGAKAQIDQGEGS